MAINYPQDCDTSAKKIEWLYNAQELLRHIHNLFSNWLHNDITQEQYDNPPLPNVPLSMRAEVRTAFGYIKTNYPFKTRLTEQEFYDFLHNDFEPRMSKISVQVGVQKTLLKESSTWTIDVSVI